MLGVAEEMSLEESSQVDVIILEGSPSAGGVEGGAADAATVVGCGSGGGAVVLGVASDVRSSWRNESKMSKSPSKLLLL